MGARRPAYRPPYGLPQRARWREDWRGTAVSIVIHALLLALLVSPTLHSGFSASPALGAGGPGPAGGGGGSFGGATERLRFISVARPPALSPLAVPDMVKVPPPAPPVRPPAAAAASITVAPATSGAGTASSEGGAGPGSGGGVGSGIGTGRGTGVGPGTGGGSADQYPPTPREFFLPPLPAPNRIKPYHLIAWFEVDERGNAKLLGFNPSRDNSYNRRLREVLLELRFRPGVRADGTPVRDTVDVHYIF